MLGDRFNEQLQSIYSKGIDFLVVEIGKMFDETPFIKVNKWSFASIQVSSSVVPPQSGGDENTAAAAGARTLPKGMLSPFSNPSKSPFPDSSESDSCFESSSQRDVTHAGDLSNSKSNATTESANRNMSESSEADHSIDQLDIQKNLKMCDQ